MTLLQKKHRQKCQRRLRTLFPGFTSSLNNFSSLDYLNLISHPYVKELSTNYSVKWGSGFLPTRRISSYETALQKTESRFANFLGFETITFYETDQNLFSQIVSATQTPTSSISLKTGLFSPLEKAVDDSLSFSVLGEHGFGLASQQNNVDILFGNFHKSFGSYVSYIACTKQTKSELFDKLPQLHKEQYISPLFLGMIDASLQLIPSMQSERKQIFKLKQMICNSLRKIGFCPTDTKAPFVSLSFSNPLELKNLHFHLSENAFIPYLTSSSLVFFPNLTLSERVITSLFSTFSSYKELPYIEAL